MKFPNYLFVLTLLFMTLGSSACATGEATTPGIDRELEKKIKTLSSPAEAHQVLHPFAGNWAYSGNFWMAPDAPAVPMTGTAINDIVFSGRFLRQKFQGPWMGKAFKGVGYTGYDNVKAEYVSTWLDNLGTGIMTVSGQYDPVSKTLNLAGANSCPMTGEKARPGRSTWTILDNDHNVFTSYSAGPDGQEFKVMEINYTRTV